MAGEAKRDYPASIFYQSPWYKKYNRIETYFGRVNTALRSGKPKVRIGVIHPVESYWLYYGPQDQTSYKREKLENQFKQVTEWLLFGLQDFDFISESLMNSLKQQEPCDGFSVGEMSYDTVIIPGCVTLRSTTLNRLSEFMKSGGKVIVMGDLPKYTDGLENEKPGSLLENTVLIPFDYANLMEVLKEQREVDIYNEQGLRSDNLLYQMREVGENKVLFIAAGKEVPNHDIPTGRTYRVSIKGTYLVTVLDAMTGDKKPYAVNYRKGNTELDYELYQEDSLLLYLEPGIADKELSNESNPQYKLYSILTGRHGYQNEEPNVLMLDQCEYSLDGEAYQAKEEILRIDNILRKKLGYPLKNAAVAQPWTEADVDKDTHVLKLRYTFESEIDNVMVDLAVELADNLEINLNGEELPVGVKGYYVDNSIQLIGLNKVRAGLNELILTIPYGRKTNLEWCYILGEFGVKISGNTAALVAKPEQIGFSDLAGQAFPFYGGNMNYICDVEAEDGEYELNITKFRAPLLSIKIDGKEAGDIMFAPYRLKLGHLSGKHQLQITSYGNRINTFGPVHCCDEGMKWMGPDAWRTEGVRYSYEYQLKRTGILAAPELMKKI
jgi:hypothetical protein